MQIGISYFATASEQ